MKNGRAMQQQLKEKENQSRSSLPLDIIQDNPSPAAGPIRRKVPICLKVLASSSHRLLFHPFPRCSCSCQPSNHLHAQPYLGESQFHPLACHCNNREWRKINAYMHAESLRGPLHVGPVLRWHGKDTKCYYICNPLSGEWIAAVPYHRSFDTSLCSFYFHVRTGEYRLLGAFSNKDEDEDKSEFEVTTVGVNTWRRVKSSSIIDFRMHHRPALTLHGKVHWVVGKRGIIFFDTDSEEFWQISSPCIPKNFCGFMPLIEIEGRPGLCTVKSETQMDIWVLKDYASGEWIKRHAISLQGIKDAPNMHLIDHDLPLIALKNDTQLLFGVYLEEQMLLYDLKLKELKEIAFQDYYHQPHVLFMETLLSGNYVNQQNLNNVL